MPSPARRRSSSSRPSAATSGPADLHLASNQGGTEAATGTGAPADAQIPPGHAGHPGHESRAVAGDHGSLKLWLRLLACSTQIETEIRRRLRLRFGTTLSRFDYLAQLQRHPEGLRMNALSRCLMVTGGNVTGLTDQLQAEGWVQRSPAPDDRRAAVLTLTPLGRQQFEAMASEHEAWVVELFAGLADGERQALHGLLGRLRGSVAQAAAEPPPPGDAPPASEPA